MSHDRLFTISFLCLFICCSFSNCSHFCNRVLQVHKIDTVFVDKGRVVDSVFVFKKIKDTFKTDRLTIYRDSDHFRYYFRERNCTTHISRTIIQPERIREIKEKERERSFLSKLGFFEKAIMFLSFLFLNLILFIYVFRRRP